MLPGMFFDVTLFIPTRILRVLFFAGDAEAEADVG